MKRHVHGRALRRAVRCKVYQRHSTRGLNNEGWRYVLLDDAYTVASGTVVRVGTCDVFSSFLHREAADCRGDAVERNTHASSGGCIATHDGKQASGVHSGRHQALFSSGFYLASSILLYSETYSTEPPSLLCIYHRLLLLILSNFYCFLSTVVTGRYYVKYFA